jgi:hypothetical protein
MLLDELLARRSDIATLARRFGARRIRVFGSVARREESPDSDIDLLVDFPRGYDLFAQRLPLAQRTERTAAPARGFDPGARTEPALCASTCWAKRWNCEQGLAALRPSRSRRDRENPPHRATR